jgi:RsiW-degrading membrane proteinase PrsW (M82 family)
MTIITLIILWLFLMAFYLLWWKFRDDRMHGRNFFNFGDYNFLVASITALVLLWGGFTLFSPEPKFSNPDEQAEFGNETHQPWLVTDAMWKKIDADPYNPDYHFRLVERHFAIGTNPFGQPDVQFYNRQGAAIYNYYSDLCEPKYDAGLNDIGNLFLAFYYVQSMNPENYDAAAFHLRQVNNRNLKYLNYVEGELLLYQSGTLVAEPYFEEEIRVNGFKEGAWSYLADIYASSNRDDELKKLIYSPESREAVPVQYRYKTYFLSGDLLSFYELRFRSMFGQLNLWGILGDLLILFTWLFFLRRLSFLSPVKWKHFFLAVGIGALLAMLSWLLYEFYHHVLHFWTNGEIGNDLLFSFLGIGLIEELVKLIPFLLLLRFTKIIKRPIDYLLIASAAGLGFAFFENLLYFSKYGLDVIHSRALTSSVSHMASSAIVAYGFVLLKFRYPKKWWIVPVFFLLAVFAHGFYDFWLLNDKVHRLAIVTLFFFLSEILVYVSFLNNALNISTGGITQTSSLSLNTQRLSAFIAGALLLVFALEYTGTCIIYGTTIGNHSLMNSFFSGGYLIFFLSVRLSNIDIIPGQWMKIEFFSGILPSEILGGSKKLNQNSVVGLHLLFEADDQTKQLGVQLPFSGHVRRRLRMKGFSGWFVVELDKPLQVGNAETRLIYIRAKYGNELISKEDETTVGVFVRKKEEKKITLTFVDWVLAK